MSKKEVIAYAITHAPKGVKGGPYESWGREAGESCRALAAAYRTEHQDMAEEIAADARNAGAKHARVIRIVRKARPSPSEDATKAERVANSERLRIVGKNMCGLLMDMRVATRDDIAERVTFALREINSFLPADSKVSVPEVDPSPSEASAVEVLRDMLATWEARGIIRVEAFEAARRILAAAGPDPSEVVRAAMAWSEATAANGTARTVALQLACVAYRKAGGK